MFAFIREIMKRAQLKKEQQAKLLIRSLLRSEIINRLNEDNELESALGALAEPFIHKIFKMRGVCWYLTEEQRGFGQCMIRGWLKGGTLSCICQRELFTKYDPRSCPHIKKAKYAE